MGKFQPQPVQGNKMVEEDGHPTEAYRKWLDLIPKALTSAASQPIPTATNSNVSPSGFACDESFLYVVTPSGIWKKVALTAL